MFSSLKIGRYFGIDVFVHPTFWLLPLFVLFTSGLSGGPETAVLELAVLFAVFGCVALHEFGHALAARWYDVKTRDITLYPIGGVARLENVPERPWPEIVIALAGPAVNVAIAALIVPIVAFDGYSLQEGLFGPPTVGAFWTRLLVANVALVLFNLIPAFPMDGGRVFRAAVSLFTDRVTATEVAAVVGMVLAGLIGLVGLLGMNPMLMILAFAVVVMGQGELAAVRYQDAHRRALRRAAARFPIVYPTREIPVARRVVRPIPQDGWEFDPVTRVWTFWEDGIPVRRVQAD
jgi:Zn-dependent protease